VALSFRRRSCSLRIWQEDSFFFHPKRQRRIRYFAPLRLGQLVHWRRGALAGISFTESDLAALEPPLLFSVFSFAPLVSAFCSLPRSPATQSLRLSCRAAWVLIWGVTTQPDGQIPDTESLQIAWFMAALFCGLSIVVHAILDRARSKHRNK
jgi:hypothetical protein